MAYRLVEVVYPTESANRVAELLAGEETSGFWTEPLGEPGKSRARVLVRTESTERLTDRLSTIFAGRDEFRLMLFRVEAVLPVEEEPEPEVTAAESTAQKPAEERRGPKRVSREELYQNIGGSAQLDSIYLAMVTLSTLVAAVGLLRGDVAVVVGAMVIAPLLGPNVALAFAATLGDLKLGKRALVTTLAGITVAAVMSVILGAVTAVDPELPTIAARSSVSRGDFVLALAAGSAGALAFTTGLPSTLIGVMVAVALLPPLVTAGLLFGAGRLDLAGKALLLVLTNITCLNLAAIATFLVQRVRPKSWWEARKARKRVRIALTLWAALVGVLALVLFLLSRGAQSAG